MQNPKLLSLQQRISHTFSDAALLIRALTHRSASENHNERFEFLGDSVLGMVISHHIFNTFPQLPEGDLSRLRAYLVRGETLATIALEIGLGDCLILGQGEMKSGGFRRESILADALEALFAAIFIDAGLDAARKSILSVYEQKLNNPDLLFCLKDSKTRLQEHQQAEKKELPLYQLIKISGDGHDQTFHIRCTLTQMSLSTEANGDTRRKAEQQAARLMLKKLGLK